MAVEDVAAHARTQDESAYYAPLRVSAVLEAPIRRGSLPIGVASCEHIGGCRHWTADEQEIIAILAYNTGVYLRVMAQDEAVSVQHAAVYELRASREGL